MKIFATQDSGQLGKGSVVCLETFSLLPALPHEVGFESIKEAQKVLTQNLQAEIEESWGIIEDLQQRQKSLHQLFIPKGEIKYCENLKEMEKVSQKLSMAHSRHVFLLLSLREILTQGS